MMAMHAWSWTAPERTVRVVSRMGVRFLLLQTRHSGSQPTAATANCVAVSIHIQYISPASGSLVAVANRVAENGRYSTFRVMVYEGERIIAEFDGVAIRLDTYLA